MNTEGLVDNGIDDSGRYQILNEIGRGSFAPVYRAWDEIDKKFVAIKLFNLEDGEIIFVICVSFVDFIIIFQQWTILLTIYTKK